MIPYQKLQEELEHFNRLIQQVLKKMEQASRPATETILDDVELCQLLHVSKRTTATWRKEGLIKHSWLLGKCYYKYSDVLEAIDQNAIKPMKNKLKIKL